MLEPTVGIEVHVELKSNAKIFSNSRNDFNKEPNIYTNVIDLGYPGTLPILNKRVIDMALSAAIALNCKINKKMHFDRKNYFYADLPKGYQITQNDTPIGYDGYIEINVGGHAKKIGIEEIHMEEDTCKSIHNEMGTLLNANRAGVPLLEIVSKPDISSAEEAVAYVEKLREILLYLGISDVKIEEGSMRCDVNVSVKPVQSETLGTKIEVKNVGSISSVAVSVEYETKRQSNLIDEGKEIRGETRRFDTKTNTTILMRYKEIGNDYRYFPEPDIPYIIIDDAWINDIKSKMPVFADTLKDKYRKIGINENNIKTIVSRLDICQFLESVIDEINPIIASNLLTGDILNYLNKNSLIIANTKIDSNNFKQLVKLLDMGKISSKQVKEIIPIVATNGENIDDIIKTLGFEQISDINSLQEIVKQICMDNSSSVNDYKAGNERALKYLMGQIMKLTNGQANPKTVNEMLIEYLSND